MFRPVFIWYRSGSSILGWIPIRIQGFEKKHIFLKSKTTIYLSLGHHKGPSSYKRSLQLSKKNIKHFKTWNFLNCLYFCDKFLPSSIRIRIPNKDPDTMTWLNSDPIRIRIRNTDFFPSRQRVSAYQDRRRCEGRQSRSAATPLPSPLAGWRRRTCGTGSCGTPPGPCLGVTKRGHLSWLTNSALRIWAQMRGVAESQPLSTAVHTEPK